MTLLLLKLHFKLNLSHLKSSYTKLEIYVLKFCLKQVHLIKLSEYYALV